MATGELSSSGSNGENSEKLACILFSNSRSMSNLRTAEDHDLYFTQ